VYESPNSAYESRAPHAYGKCSTTIPQEIPENIGQLYILFWEKSFTPLLNLQEKNHRPASEGGNNDSNARVFR